MIFSSLEFLLLFLPLFLVLYGLTPDKYKNMTLVLGSLIFYALGEPKYLALLLLSVTVNYFFGLHLGRKVKRKSKDHDNKKQYKQSKSEIRYRQSKAYKKQRGLLVFAIVLNVGLLAFFKYAMPAKGIPLGISFYTFRILSYLIDVFRGDEEKETSFLNLATYIVMFPMLVEGPIAGYGEVRAAINQRKFSLWGVQEGLKVFTMGLAAKVLLADRIGLLWQEVQVTGFESISTPLAWLAAIAYSLRLYFDFYGYSLMAVGLGKMLGFELPANFKNPYMAHSVRDFYRRWHVTLGRWFCKYVYIPLGGSRTGEVFTAMNLVIVWYLTSIWHGSTFNYVVWGLSLAVLIIAERQLAKVRLPGWMRLPVGVLSRLYLWAVIPVTWMCFAITDMGQLSIFLGRMFGQVSGVFVSAGDWKRALADYWPLFATGLFACTSGMQKICKKLKDNPVGILLLVGLFWLCVWRLQAEGQNPFMYSNF